MDVTTQLPIHDAMFRQNQPQEDTIPKSLFDAYSVTRTALFGGADTWFDAFWYCEARESRFGRIRKAARLLRERIVAARICSARGPGWFRQGVDDDRSDQCFWPPADVKAQQTFGETRT
jgi:hypothetical protein